MSSRQFLVLFFGFVLGAGSMAGESDQEAKIEQVIGVVREISQIPEETIPPALLVNARAVAVIPAVIKIGLIIGGRYGKGAISLRKADGSWSHPSFVTLTGGSVGWQIGAQSTDVVLVFKSGQSVKELIEGKFTLGADASVAAGPVGRSASAATDLGLQAEVYSYSRSRGLFAGIALDGASLELQDSDNARYYRESGITPQRIFSDDTSYLPPSARQLTSLLNREIK